MPDPEYTISLFNKALHDRSAFSCGVDGIDRWVKTSISSETKDDRTRLWCASNPEGELVGVYALNPHCVEPAEGGGLAKERERRPIPTLYLSCLAIDQRFQGQGLGEALMGHAIERAVKLSAEIPVAAIILDVHRDEHFERRHAFYARLGFTILYQEKPERMYLPIADARKALELQADASQKAPVA